jgi:AcrR family transcriptional regulator
MAGSDGGLRERKKQETRTALGWAAIQLCVERGWANVSAEDIAARAKVSERTFRNYFASKAEAVASRHVDRMWRICADLRGRPATGLLWADLTDAVLAEFSPTNERGQEQAPTKDWVTGITLLLSEPALRGELLKASTAVQAELAAVIAERTNTDVRHNLYPNLVAGAVGAGLTVVMDHWLNADPVVLIGPLVREAMAALENGLSVP